MRFLILITTLLPLSLLAEPSSWTPLFNGKDLTGWHTMPGGKWEVVDGAITGISEKPAPLLPLSDPLNGDPKLPTPKANSSHPPGGGYR